MNTTVEKLPIVKVLQLIQTEVNAPKGNEGRFGKSRSAEDIIAAAKPVLAKYQAAMTLSDEIIQVGDRNYVQSTATLLYEDQSILVHANAWEGDVSRGLDASQITGAASSYARKYAMGGLLAVDDTKDADHQIDTEVVRSSQTQPVKTVNTPLAKAKKELQDMFEAYGHDNEVKMKVVIHTVLQKNRVDTVDEATEVMQALTDGLV